MTPRLLKWALIVSLAVNVLIAMAVVGALWSAGPGRGVPDGARDGERRRGGGPPEIAALARGLDRADRQALIQALRDDGALRAGRARMLAARADVARALRSDPFDRAAFEAAMEAQRALQAELAARGIVALGGVMTGLTAPERAGLADRLEAGGRR